MSEWISVSDNLPEMNEAVLAYNGDSIEIAFRTEDGFFNDGITWYWTHYDYIEWKGVTHWMPLPETPKS